MLYYTQMKSIYNKDQRLESHHIFPYIAWLVIIIFVWFVYSLVSDLKATADELRIKNQSLHAKTEIPVKEIKDFSN